MAFQCSTVPGQSRLRSNIALPQELNELPRIPNFYPFCIATARIAGIFHVFAEHCFEHCQSTVASTVEHCVLPSQHPLSRTASIVNLQTTNGAAKKWQGK